MNLLLLSARFLKLFDSNGCNQELYYSKLQYRDDLQWLPYAEEADLLNVALFGFTAKAWRESNPELAKSSNVRDYATINELMVLSNLETHNAQMIRDGKSKEERQD